MHRIRWHCELAADSPILLQLALVADLLCTDLWFAEHFSTWLTAKAAPRPFQDLTLNIRRGNITYIQAGDPMYYQC